MDSLDVILQTVREELQRQAKSGATHDAALDEAEMRARRILGGARHYIARLPKADLLRTIQVLPPDLTPAQIAERCGISVSQARRMIRLVRPPVRRGA